MITILEQLATSFVASAAFGLIFNVPKRSLVQCGIVGMLGWALYVALTQQAVNVTIATLIAAGCVAVFSQIMAKLYRMPIIVFNVSGIIPLVPGGLAYNAMRSAVENEFDAALFSTPEFGLSNTHFSQVQAGHTSRHALQRMQRESSPCQKAKRSSGVIFSSFSTSSKRPLSSTSPSEPSSSS